MAFSVNSWHCIRLPAHGSWRGAGRPGPRGPKASSNSQDVCMYWTSIEQQNLRGTKKTYSRAWPSITLGEQNKRKNNYSMVLEIWLAVQPGWVGWLARRLPGQVSSASGAKARKSSYRASWDRVWSTFGAKARKSSNRASWDWFCWLLEPKPENH